MDLDRIYGHRFGVADETTKQAVWGEIGLYLQRWIPADAKVLDVACDAGYFIRHVSAAELWANDVRDVSAQLPAGVRFVQADGGMLSASVPQGYFDIVFASNYLEHLTSTDAVVAQMHEFAKILRPGGRLIVLQPNIRFVGPSYWDFIDHRVALTEVSLVESARAAGFDLEHLIPRFLPYTTKSRFPRHPWLVRAYLRFPIAWRVLGKQTLLVARNRGTST